MAGRAFLCVLTNVGVAAVHRPHSRRLATSVPLISCEQQLSHLHLDHALLNPYNLTAIAQLSACIAAGADACTRPGRFSDWHDGAYAQACAAQPFSTTLLAHQVLVTWQTGNRSTARGAACLPSSCMNTVEWPGQASAVRVYTPSIRESEAERLARLLESLPPWKVTATVRFEETYSGVYEPLPASAQVGILLAIMAPLLVILGCLYVRTVREPMAALDARSSIEFPDGSQATSKYVPPASASAQPPASDTALPVSGPQGSERLEVTAPMTNALLLDASPAGALLGASPAAANETPDADHPRPPSDPSASDDAPHASESTPRNAAADTAAAVSVDARTASTNSAGTSSLAARLRAAFSTARHLRELVHRPEGQLEPLDGLRAFAVLWVLMFHAFVFWPLFCCDFTGDGHYVHGAAPVVTRSYSQLKYSVYMMGVLNGDMGVDVFFCLSGFLISYLLLKDFAKARSTHGRSNLAEPRMTLAFHAIGSPCLQSIHFQSLSAQARPIW